MPPRLGIWQECTFVVGVFLGVALDVVDVAAVERGYYQICIYENIGKTNQPQEDNLRVVAAGERFSVEFQPDPKSGQYDVYFFRSSSMEHWGTSRFRQRFSLFRRLGLWFGGTSKAPQEMYIRAEFSKDGL